MREVSRYWFPAKRYGWGWGFPVTWQGWLVLGIFAVLVCAGLLLLPVGSWPHVVYNLVLVAALILVCWSKGEPPRWRWGR